MTAASVSISQLELWYGDFHALRGIDLSLGQGEFLALLGPSGCGKTSLLRSIAGFAHPQKGSIRISGEDVIDTKPRDRNLGIVFQHYALFPHITAAENVAFGLKCRHVPAAEMQERVKRALDLVGLSGLADRKPRQLSGGQQQRVALARALVIEPRVLLLDEPLGALDKKLRIQMQSELKTIQKRLNVTAIFVTHDQEEALAMADTIALMRDGRIEQIGPPERVFSAPETSWVAEFVGCGNVLVGKLRDSGNGVLKLDGLPGCSFAIRKQPDMAGSADTPLFVRAEKVKLAPTEDDNALEVASHRYLGVYVEVIAKSGDHVIKALLPPGEAQALSVGQKVSASAAPEDCRLITGRSP
jgi:ABC-type Fe3+/spermidine/putrescine transport system ATPase subunit